MFPGADAVVYRNEEGEPIGWDYPGEFGNDYDDPYYDDDRFYYDDEED